MNVICVRNKYLEQNAIYKVRFLESLGTLWWSLSNGQVNYFLRKVILQMHCQVSMTGIYDWSLWGPCGAWWSPILVAGTSVHGWFAGIICCVTPMALLLLKFSHFVHCFQILVTPIKIFFGQSEVKVFKNISISTLNPPQMSHLILINDMRMSCPILRISVQKISPKCALMLYQQISSDWDISGGNLLKKKLPSDYD